MSKFFRLKPRHSRKNFFPDEKSAEFSSVVSRKGGMIFSDDQTEIYWRLFRDLIVSNERITQHYVKTKIEEDEEARKAIVGFTPQQLVDHPQAAEAQSSCAMSESYDKIRTERRTIARAQDKKKVGHYR